MTRTYDYVVRVIKNGDPIFIKGFNEIDQAWKEAHKHIPSNAWTSPIEQVIIAILDKGCDILYKDGHKTVAITYGSPHENK